MGRTPAAVRKGGAPQVMAALRNSVIHVLSDVVSPSLASAIRSMGNCLTQALRFSGCRSSNNQTALSPVRIPLFLA